MKKPHWQTRPLFSFLILSVFVVSSTLLPHAVNAAGAGASDDPDPCLLNAPSASGADAAITAADSGIIGPNIVIDVPVNSIAENFQLAAIQASTCATRKATVAEKDKNIGITVFGIPRPYSSWDAILKALMKIIINRVTDSTVKWINSGFNGNPVFITNPANYFGNIANGFAGDFLGKVAGGNLCAPFKPQIVLSLQKSFYGAYNPQCTLTGIGHNLENFYNNFSEGGWESWFAMTQNASNNPYDAYLDAKVQLDQGIANKTGLAKLEADWNKGFLSTKTCIKTNQQAEDEYLGRDVTTLGLDPNGCDGNNGSEVGPTKTPGTVIATQLDKLLGQGTDDLGLARSFDDLVSALLGALTKKVFSSSDGLFSGGGSNYSASGAGVYNAGSVDTGAGGNPSAAVICSPDKTFALIGDTVTWTATAPQSDSITYSFAWSGDEVAPGNSDSILTQQYATEGGKSVRVLVTSVRSAIGGSATSTQTSTIICSPQVTISKYAPLKLATCAVDPTRIQGRGTATWSATIIGGSGKINLVKWYGDNTGKYDGGDFHYSTNSPFISTSPDHSFQFTATKDYYWLKGSSIGSCNGASIFGGTFGLACGYNDVAVPGYKSAQISIVDADSSVAPLDKAACPAQVYIYHQ